MGNLLLLGWIGGYRQGECGSDTVVIRERKRERLQKVQKMKLGCKDERWLGS